MLLGRGRRGGRRGGRGGRANIGDRNGTARARQPIQQPDLNPADDSGEEINEAANENQQIDHAGVFNFNEIAAAANIIDGASSDEEINVEVPEERERAFDVRLHRHQYIAVNVLPNGDPAHQLNYAFESGLTNQSKTVNFYADWSVIQIILHLATGFFETLLTCTNRYYPTATISMKDLYLYHAFLTLTTYYELTTTDEYWAPSIMHWDERIQPLIDAMSRYKFYNIRSKFRGYTPEDADLPPDQKDRGWKVGRILRALQNIFQNLFDGPGEILSLDEGMARGSSTRNPIYVTLGNAKPLEGFRFFLLIDYETKCCVNFSLDTKSLTAANTSNFPGGFVGAVVDQLCGTANLPGRWYKIFMDNYYGSDQIARHLRNTRSINIVATLQKKYLSRS